MALTDSGIYAELLIAEVKLRFFTCIGPEKRVVRNFLNHVVSHRPLLFADAPNTREVIGESNLVDAANWLANVFI